MKIIPLLCLCAALPTPAAFAQPIADPTRPPPAAAAAVPAAAPTSAPATPAPAVEPPRLQSVQLARGGASTALVDGRIVRVGDRVGATEVVAIDPEGLVLRGARGAERIWLLAGLRGTPATSPPPLPAAPTMAAAGDR